MENPTREGLIGDFNATYHDINSRLCRLESLLASNVVCRDLTDSPQVPLLLESHNVGQECVGHKLTETG